MTALNTYYFQSRQTCKPAACAPPCFWIRTTEAPDERCLTAEDPQPAPPPGVEPNSARMREWRQAVRSCYILHKGKWQIARDAPGFCQGVPLEIAQTAIGGPGGAP